MDGGMFARLGRFAVRRRWYVIGAWLVLAMIMGSFARGLQGRLGQGGFEVPGSDSLTVFNELKTQFHQDLSTGLVVVRNGGLSLDDRAFRDQMRAIQDRVAAVPGVSTVQSLLNGPEAEFASGDGHTTYLIAQLTGDQNRQLFEATAVTVVAGCDVSAGFQVVTGGGPAFYDRFNQISRDDLAKAEQSSFPITLFVLLVAFGSLVAAGLPIMLAVISLVVTLGALYFLAGATSMSVYVTNTASIIGIGVGIDYALFVVTRFREELRLGRSVSDSVMMAVATSGRAVALSGATVIVALAGMFLVSIQAFRSMAIGSMSVVAVAVLGAITLLPAVLSLVGPRIDRLRLPLRRRRRAAAADAGVPSSGFWHAWAMRIMRRPWAWLGVSLAVLLTLAVPFASIRLGQSGPRILPAGEQPRVASERLAAEFGAGVTGPMEILVDTTKGAAVPGNDPRAKVEALVRRLQADPRVAAVIPSLGATGVVRLTVVGKDAPESRAAEDLLQRVRDGDIPASGLSDNALVGGTTAFNVDLNHAISGHLPAVVGTVLALSFLLLVMAFRSLILPLKAVVMNLLSVAASYGLLVAVFQWGWGQRLLGFTSEGHIAVFVPLFLFSILFGLSMDYEVFLLTRMREEYRRTGSNELAVANGLESSARTITSAALIMVTVFVAFATSRLVPFKEMGFGLAAAVFIDATIVRTVLVPATMRLMGRWNWWMPAWLDRLLPRIDLEVSTGSPGAVTEAALQGAPA